MANLRKFPVAASVLPTLTFGHTGTGPGASFSSGLIHPLTGLGHLLVLVAVGWWAATCDGRASWAIPLGFLVCMGLGAGLAWSGWAIPGAEAAVAVSVVTMGVLLGSGGRTA